MLWSNKTIVHPKLTHVQFFITPSLIGSINDRIFHFDQSDSHLPHWVKMQYVHFRLHTTYFLLLRKIPEELADDQCSSITKGSIYHIKHISIQPFTTGLNWYNKQEIILVKGLNWAKIACYCKYLLCLIIAHTAFLHFTPWALLAF